MANPRITAIIDAKDNASAVLQRFGGSLKLVAAAAAGAFAVSVGVKAVRAAAEFQTALTNVSTLLEGDSTQAINDFREGILKLTEEVPKSANELGAAAYDIVSAGISDTAEALNVLRASSRLAVAGLGDTKEAVNLMTGALNAFASQNIKADDAADIFFKTVKSGKTTVAELSQAFGQVAPIAATVGVRLEELQAATAALTTANIPTSIAQTQLRSAMVALIKPSSQMEELLTAIGVASGKAAIEQFGLVGTLQKLTDAAGGNETVLAEAFGRVEGLNAALSLTGQQASTFTDILAGMTDGVNVMNEAVDKQTETFESQVEILRNKWNKIMIETASESGGLGLATKGVQVLISLLDALEGTIQLLSDAWDAWTDVLAKNLQTVEKFVEVGKTVGNVLSTVTGARFVGEAIGRAVVPDVVIPPAPQSFQSGGIVAGPLGKPQLALVHGGERVLPVSGVRGGGQVVVNITGNTISSELDIRDLADRVGREITRTLQLAQNV